MALLSWLSVFCYVFSPKVFIYLNFFTFTSVALIPVLFFRLIRYLTRLEDAENFSPLHYLIPALIGLTFLIWSLFVPFDVQMEVVMSRKTSIAGEYEIFSRFLMSKPLQRMAFTFVYYGFISHILICFYRQASATDNSMRKPARWIILLIILSLVFLVSFLMSTITPKDKAVDAISTMVAAFVTSGQYIVLSYHIIRRRYLLYVEYSEPEEQQLFKPENGKTETGRKLHAGKLTRQRLNNYFLEQKPYLKMDFRITDLTEVMDVNRSVISAFINKHYGMNFSRLVNRQRLREVERLRTLSSNQGKSIAQLVVKAGFKEARQYYRALAVEREEESKRL
jgi:AraC-like DNA-binding protein